MTIEEMKKKLNELRQGMADLQATMLRNEGAVLMLQQLITEAEKTTSTAGRASEAQQE